MALSSRSNVGPLFGIFVIGPLATFAGSAFAISRRDDSSDLLLALLWIASLAYTFFTLRLATRFGIWGAASQGIVLIAAIERRSRIVAVAAIGIAMTLFPPVTGLSHFAFLLDPLFDTSQHRSHLVIEIRTFLLEWLATVVVGTALALPSRYNARR